MYALNSVLVERVDFVVSVDRGCDNKSGEPLDRVDTVVGCSAKDLKIPPDEGELLSKTTVKGTAGPRATGRVSKPHKPSEREVQCVEQGG